MTITNKKKQKDMGFAERKLFITVAIIAAIFVAGLIVLNNIATPAQPPAFEQDQLANLEPADEERVFDQSITAVLDAFPQDLPVERGVEGNSYVYIPPNSTMKQYSVHYVSMRSFTENEALFGEYLEDNGYELINEVDEPNLRFFYGVKNGTILTVSIQQENGQIAVSVSYVVE